MGTHQGQTSKQDKNSLWSRWYMWVLPALAIITNKEISVLYCEYFKPWWTISSSLFDLLYCSDFNEIAFAVIGIEVAILIPFLIAIYESMKGIDALSANYIQSKFTQKDILCLVICIFTSGISRNSLFVFGALSYSTYYLAKIAANYFNFIHNKKNTLLYFAKKIVRESTAYKKKFIRNSEKFFNELSKIIPKINEPTSNFSTVYFSSKKNVVNVKISELSKWAKTIKKKASHYTANTTNDDIQVPPEKIFWDTSFSNEEKQIHLTLKIPSKILVNETEDDFRKKSQEAFDKIFTLENSTDPADLVSNLDSYILTLTRQNNIASLEEYLDILKKVLADPETQDIRLLENINHINYKLFSYQNSAQNDSLVVDLYFDYWKSCFIASLKYPHQDFVKKSLMHLAHALDDGVFSSITLDSLDRFFTTFYRYNKINTSFLINLFNGLIEASFYLFRNKNTEMANAFISYISFVEKDFSSKNHKPIAKYEEIEEQQFVQLARQAMISVCFHFINDKNDVQFIKKLLALIDTNHFLKTLESLYTQPISDRLSVIDWGDYHFDRHGAGGVRSFSLINFLQKGATYALKEWGYPENIFDNFKISPNSQHFFVQLEEKIKKETGCPEAFTQRLNKLNNEAKRNELQQIADSELDQSKIEGFTELSNNQYRKITKFSAIFSSREDNTRISDQALGIYMLFLKDSFVPDKDVGFDFLAEVGENLALGENRWVYSEIAKTCISKKNSKNDFFKNELPTILSKIKESEKIVFIGKTYHITSRFFSWGNNKCIYNDAIAIDRENEENNTVKILFKKKTYKISILNTDQLEHDAFLVAEQDALSLIYQKVEGDDTNIYHIRDNNTRYEFIHLAKKPELIRSIITKGQYQFEAHDDEGKKAELETRLGFKLYVSPIIDIKHKDRISIYELEGDTDEED